jgi:Ca2+-transporting ATPase
MTDHPLNEPVDWHALSTEEAIKRLESRAEGLDSAEAERRLADHGPNQLQQARGRPAWKRLLEQFNNILILILLAAAAASLGLGHTLDAIAISGVVLIIALIGFIQEGKAEQALNSIRNMLSPRAQVVRDGRRCEIPAEQLVPGDIVLVESGDRVPADLRLLEAKRLRDEEAALTGESTPVDKAVTAVAEATDLAPPWRRQLTWPSVPAWPTPVP